ncbi:TadG family pilus assembly protein [Variovorax paradoxus]|uniref:Membrane protein n=1 Tax=Variovorax paradoxus TaxID=34073 RepID=A0AAW8ELQ1_VARPD|nr:pilus assembly protein TadG-related protein [Variovorax paradoxus]MDP9973547.1 putative membrane protein [Variovorax paradoxus]
MKAATTRQALQLSGCGRIRGSILINTAIALSLIVITLVGTELGYLFYMKREFQKTADLAALAGAQKLVPLPGTDVCIAAQGAAIANAGKNMPGIVLQQPECGHWASSNTTPVNAGCFSNVDDHFLPYASTKNAIRVRIEKAPPTLLPFFQADRTICVQAVASLNEPIGAISIGSGVARLNDGLLNQVLGMLLGTTVNLSIADYTGLLNTKVNLLGIADALNLNVGTYEQLASANVTLAALLTAAIEVLPQNNDSATAALAAGVLNGLLNLSGGLDLSTVRINLLSTAEQTGLLSVDLNTEDPRTALNGNINALNLLLVALQIADSQSVVSAGIAVPLKPLANVQLQAKVIEPPSIAVGPPGYYPDGTAKTRAHTGQIRILLDTQILTPVAGSDLLNIPLVVKISLPSGQLIRLPIYAEVASGDAELDSIQCNAPDGKYDVKIAAAPGLAHIFLGKVPTAFTNRTSAWKDLPKEQFDLLNIQITLLSILGGGIPFNVKLLAKMDLSIPGSGTTTRQTLSYRFDPTIPASQQDLTRTVGTEQNLGAAIASAIGSGMLKIELATPIPILDTIANGLITVISGVLGALNFILLPVLAQLDSALLAPLLKTLGIQIGYADVQLLSASCDGNARLVY